jgi:integrase
MSERMRDGIIKRGSVYYYVIRERGHFPVKDRSGNPKLDEDGNQIFVDVRQRWVKGARTREATKRARDAARNAMNTGTYVAPQEETVGPFLDKWLEAHSVELKPSTVSSYWAKIDLYLKPTFGRERVQQLTPGRMSAAWKQIHESGGKGGKPVSFRTVEFARAVMRRAMQDAVLDRVITVNPVIGSKLPKRDGKAQHRTWTGPQAAEFLEATARTRWYPIWQLALASGMRRGELCGLRWEDVDLEAGVVSVERSTTQLGQERVTTTPKNHERRKITIDFRTVAVLRTWRKQQAGGRLQWGPAYVDTGGLVFTWENGSPVLPDYVTKEFGKAQAACGLELPRLVLHEARHSHATMLLRDGVPRPHRGEAARSQGPERDLERVCGRHSR